MAIDFPSSPADNVIAPNYPTVPGVAYVAKSSVWRDILGRADRYNRVVNGHMIISQQNGLTDGTVNSLVLADQFQMFWTSDVGAFRGQRVLSTTPKGSANRLRITVNTADTALTTGEYLAIGTNLEGTAFADLKWGTANGVPLVLRFGFKGPAGVYSISLRNNALDRSWVTPWTISSGQANTDTEQIMVIPPCLDGTWPNDTTRFGPLYFTLATANTTSFPNQWRSANNIAPTTITNNIGTVGNVFELFDVGLYADPNWTGQPPEWELPDITTELRRCQRYYARIFSMRGVVGTATLISRAGCPLPVPMRAIPALSIKGTPRFWDGNAGNPVTAIGSSWSSTRTCEAEITCGAGGYTAYRTAGMYWTSDTDCIIANARL